MWQQPFGEEGQKGGRERRGEEGGTTEVEWTGKRGEREMREVQGRDWQRRNGLGERRERDTDGVFRKR